MRSPHCGQSQSAWVESSTQQGQALGPGSRGGGPGGPPPSPETLICIQGSCHAADTPPLPFAQSLLRLSLSSQCGEFSSHPEQNRILPNTPASDIVGPRSMWNLNSLCVQLLSQVRLFVTPWTEDARLFYLLEFAQTMSIESLMLSDHLILSRPFFLLPDQGSNLDPCFGSSDLNHWTTRDAPCQFF